MGGYCGYGIPMVKVRNREQEGKLQAAIVRANRAAKRAARKQRRKPKC
jgi:hypothetical protein